MKTLPIYLDQIKRAENLIAKRSIKNHHFTDGSSEIFGTLAEILFFDYYKHNPIAKIQWSNSTNFDFLVFGYRSEIKAFKIQHRNQIDNRLALIPLRQQWQRTHYYHFMFILEDKTEAYLVGWLEKDIFMKEADLVEAGTPTVKNTILRTSNYCLPLDSLKGYL